MVVVFIINGNVYVVKSSSNNDLYSSSNVSGNLRWLVPTSGLQAVGCRQIKEGYTSDVNIFLSNIHTKVILVIFSLYVKLLISRASMFSGVTM